MSQKAAAYIRDKCPIQPKLGLILGTGLGELADLVTDPVVIPYSAIPHFPVSLFHAGNLVLGYLNEKPVILMQGRSHFYEGYSMNQLAIPVQAMKHLGVETLLLTNAAGGICESYAPGDVVAISDHIKFDLDSPLRGKNPDELGPRFFDMTTAYSPRLLHLAKTVAEELGMSLPQGVYAYMGGPQFETPAEIRMLRILGADLVGMSTVPEVIAARHCGIEVLALSGVSNMAAGMDQGGMDSSVIQAAEVLLKERFSRLLLSLVAGL